MENFNLCAMEPTFKPYFNKLVAKLNHTLAQLFSWKFDA